MVSGRPSGQLSQHRDYLIAVQTCMSNVERATGIEPA
jgi:hypothetical protein